MINQIKKKNNNPKKLKKLLKYFLLLLAGSQAPNLYSEKQLSSFLSLTPSDKCNFVFFQKISINSRNTFYSQILQHLVLKTIWTILSVNSCYCSPLCCETILNVSTKLKFYTFSPDLCDRNNRKQNAYLFLHIYFCKISWYIYVVKFGLFNPYSSSFEK